MADRLPRALRAPRDGGRFGLFVAVVATWVVLTLLAVAVAGRNLRAPPAALAVTVTFLPYLYVTTAIVLVLGWIVLPGRRSLAYGLLALTVAGLSMWAPRWSADVVPPDGDELRVMSWNVRRLWGGPADGGDATACVIGGIHEAAPDVVTLLEVSRDDVATLSKKAGLRCNHHPYTAVGDDNDGGVATCTVGDRWRLGDGSGLRFNDDEDWYYVASEVRGKDRVFNVLAVHLFPYRYVAKTIRKSIGKLTEGDVEPLAEFADRGEAIVKSQADQSAALLSRVDKFHDPTVISGDFNSTRDSALHANLRTTLSDTWEHGAWGFGGTVHLFDRLPLRIDYVYATPEFKVRGTRIPDFGCSDHRPVVTDLVLERPRTP